MKKVIGYRVKSTINEGCYLGPNGFFGVGSYWAATFTDAQTAYDAWLKSGLMRPDGSGAKIVRIVRKEPKMVYILRKKREHMQEHETYNQALYWAEQYSKGRPNEYNILRVKSVKA